MKRCSECGRNYNDDSMSFCLDDGAELLFGPASMDEPATSILSETEARAAASPGGESSTRAQFSATSETAVLPTGSGELVPNRSGNNKRVHLAPVALAVIILGGFFGYRYFSATSKQIESIAVMPFVNESGNTD